MFPDRRLLQTFNCQRDNVQTTALNRRKHWPGEGLR